MERSSVRKFFECFDKMREIGEKNSHDDDDEEVQANRSACTHIHTRPDNKSAIENIEYNVSSTAWPMYCRCCCCQ